MHYLPNYLSYCDPNGNWMIEGIFDEKATDIHKECFISVIQKSTNFLMNKTENCSPKCTVLMSSPNVYSYGSLDLNNDFYIITSSNNIEALFNIKSKGDIQKQEILRDTYCFLESGIDYCNSGISNCVSEMENMPPKLSSDYCQYNIDEEPITREIAAIVFGASSIISIGVCSYLYYNHNTMSDATIELGNLS